MPDRQPSWETPSRRLFRRAFDHVSRGKFGHWRLREPMPEQELFQLAAWLANPERIPEDRLLKRTENKAIFRWRGVDERPEWVVKAYYPRRWRRWLRYRRMAYGETLSQLCAQRRGLPTPEVYGYGEIRVGWQPCFVVCAQYLPLTSLRDRFLQRPRGENLGALLDRAAAMLGKLYGAGCHHVDFGPHAILISAASPDRDVLIDFESAVFLRDPSRRVFAAQAGYFAWSVATNRDWVEGRAMEQWFAGLLQQAGWPDDSQLWEIWRKCFHARQSLGWRTSVA